MMKRQLLKPLYPMNFTIYLYKDFTSWPRAVEHVGGRFILPPWFSPLEKITKLLK
jgi:hypothetical protein